MHASSSLRQAALPQRPALRQIRQEPLDVRRAQLRRVPQLVEPDEPPDPVRVRLFGAPAVLPESHGLARKPVSQNQQRLKGGKLSRKWCMTWPIQRWVWSSAKELSQCARPMNSQGSAWALGGGAKAAVEAVLSREVMRVHSLVTS